MIAPSQTTLFYWHDGFVAGVLSYYPQTGPIMPPYVSVQVAPQFRRQGIATALLKEALSRWPEIDLEKQNFSPDGLLFIKAFRVKSHRG
jgi:GNAT superfamily N-acetyltransferase